MNETANQTHSYSLLFSLDEVYRVCNEYLQCESLVALLVNEHCYIRYLQQAYHYVKATQPWLVLAATRTAHPYLRELLTRKADEEAGHEQWVLADLRALGVNTSAPEEWPVCRAIAAYITWHDFMVAEGSCESILGAAYILERLAEQHADALARRLEPAAPRGVSFLYGHGEADIAHLHELKQALRSVHCPEIVLSARITATTYLGFLRSVTGQGMNHTFGVMD